MERETDSFKWLRMTSRKWISVIIILISAPASLIGVILFISFNWIHPYTAWLLLVTIYIGTLPFLLTLIRCIIHKKRSMNFYPIISMFILVGVTGIHLLAMLTAPIDAISRSRNSLTPTIQTGEFPFRVVYELEGERFVVEDTIICSFDGWQQHSNNRRNWQTRLTSHPDRNVTFRSSRILEGEEMQGDRRREFSIYIDVGNCAYFMGERSEGRSPELRLWQTLHNPYPQRGSSSWGESINSSQVENYGITIVEFDFPQRINNSFE